MHFDHVEVHDDKVDIFIGESFVIVFEHFDSLVSVVGGEDVYLVRFFESTKNVL